MKTNTIHVSCSCGCSCLEIKQWEDEKGFGEVYISHKIDSFYALQKPGYVKFKEAIKAIWCFLTGKEYYIYEIVLVDKDQIVAFKNAVANIKENIYYQKN